MWIFVLLECIYVHDYFILLASFLGRFNLNKSLFSYCNCGLITDPFTLNSLIKSGYGPNVASNKTFIVKEDCLQLWDRYSKRSPGTSLSSFLKSLEDISIMNERVFFILHNY